MEFPIYRKRFDNGAFYKINNASSFEEIQLIGRRYFIHQIQVDKYFEKLQIIDMIETRIALYEESTADEYQKHLDAANLYLQSK